MAAETYAGLAEYIQNLARAHDPTRDASFKAQIAANGANFAATAIQLPGPECPEKAQLEKEMAALCARIDFLEHKSSIAINPSALPITPAGEPAEDGLVYTPAGAFAKPIAPYDRRGSTREQRALWVSNWLAAKESNGDASEEPAAALTESARTHRQPQC
jgi:osomolarity two-component system sensor histidine kinase NIK1